MLHWLRRGRVIQQDGIPNYHIVPSPQASPVEEAVYEMEFPLPFYPLAAGPGVVSLTGLFNGTQFRALQRPQVIAPLVAPILGPGGIPSPDQSLIFAGLEDNNQ